jgi:hypothetical protein
VLYTYIHTCTYIHTYIHNILHVLGAPYYITCIIHDMCVHTYLHTYIHVCTHTYIHTYIHVMYTCTCTYTYVCMYVQSYYTYMLCTTPNSMNVWYIFIYTHTPQCALLIKSHCVCVTVNYRELLYVYRKVEEYHF